MLDCKNTTKLNEVSLKSSINNRKAEKPFVDMLEFENNYRKLGYNFIGGIDEAGRGPLAGPVTAACVIMPLDDIIEGVNDSKKLSAKKRDFLFDLIVEKAIGYHICHIDNEVIDKINILEATKKAMVECVDNISPKPDFVLIDAVKLKLEMESEGIIKGDARSYSIACASILAKVTRDRLMVELDKKYPEYSFFKHKGYGTKIHQEAIKQHGPCEIHRNSFIKNFI